jgi:D-alanyl-lipoteichoic acid acyltransferase DltB (MBOAT superfamily)
MSVTQILILAVVAILVNQIKRGRSLALLGVSALVIYWIQPIQESVNLTFWFPTFTLGLTVTFWLLVSTPETRGWGQNWAAVAVLVGVIVFVDLNRYVQFGNFFITDTPRVQLVVVFILAFTFAGFLLARLKQVPAFVFVLAVIGLIGTLLFLKTPSAPTRLFEAVASLRGKEAAGISALSWLGFSYVSFRLMHTVIDRRAGRLPSVTLAEYMNYVIFFPAFSAGPIDRLERFQRNLNQPLALKQTDWVDAGMRLFWGLFKKFIIADALAWIALNEKFALEVRSVGWMWILLYAYSLRIYFDFSGYTDIAIGLGKLLGVQLPENFDAPYLKPNLTQFWNAWHMTLTQWFRSYFFNPLTRFMRSNKIALPMWLMVFVAQIATMSLIGLWHGVTLGFLLWGVWHGIGLFLQNRWSEWMRAHMPAWGATLWGANVLKYSGVFLTFHFVTLGWLFFFMPDPAMAWSVMLKLLRVA